MRRSTALAGASVLLVDLLLLRGQVLGRVADYERAADLADRLVRGRPGDGTAWLARAGRGRPFTVSPRRSPT